MGATPDCRTTTHRERWTPSAAADNGTYMMGSRISSRPARLVWHGGVVEPEEAAVRYWLDPLLAEAMPLLAAEWVAAGLDGPAVVRAASCSRLDDPRDVRDAFVEALKELGHWYVSMEAAQVPFVKLCARAIARSEAELAAVARRVRDTFEFDVVTYDGLPQPYLDIVAMCWLFGSEEFERNGGMARLREDIDEALSPGTGM